MKLFNRVSILQIITIFSAFIIIFILAFINKPLNEKVDLPDVNINILEKHVYGSWKITNRVVKLDETGLDFNLSSTEIKNISYDNEISLMNGCFGIAPTYTAGSVITEYIHPLGGTPVYFDANDLYLFGLYGGFNIDVENPIYSVSTVNANEAVVSDLLLSDEQKLISIGSIINTEKIIKITYDLGKNYSYVKRRSFGDILYIFDENDFDTLYLDFCGLWEMKRLESCDEIPSNIESRRMKG